MTDKEFDLLIEESMEIQSSFIQICDEEGCNCNDALSFRGLQDVNEFGLYAGLFTIKLDSCKDPCLYCQPNYIKPRFKPDYTWLSKEVEGLSCPA